MPSSRLVLIAVKSSLKTQFHKNLEKSHMAFSPIFLTLRNLSLGPLRAFLPSLLPKNTHLNNMASDKILPMMQSLTDPLSHVLFHFFKREWLHGTHTVVTPTDDSADTLVSQLSCSLPAVLSSSFLSHFRKHRPLPIPTTPPTFQFQPPLLTITSNFSASFTRMAILSIL